MRYYVVADPHSFFTEMKTALEEQGYFTDEAPHKLIICGDLFDRGQEALQMQDFLLELMRKDQVILIRGNHEDLALQLLDTWHLGSYLAHHHLSNGTVDTVFQLTHCVPNDLFYNDARIGKRFLNSAYVQKIIPAMVDFFETPHYIFVHGWIPCAAPHRDAQDRHYQPHPDWRSAGPDQWERARWINGMEAHHMGIREPGKTIVCGHKHCCFGHSHYEEGGKEADYSPYYAEGIIALDAGTARSGRVNCIVIED